MLGVPSNAADPNATTATVTVRGDAIIRAEPDEAMLWITLSSLEDAPGPALSDVSARSNTLVALLNDLGVAKADRSTTGITVYEDFDHTQSGRRSLGHRAISRVSVRLTDPDLIGRLIAQATENLAARIDGPRWQIAHSNPVRLEAAREAAADGRRKAQAYANGVGAKLGRLIRLSEPDDVHVAARAAGGLRPMVAEPIPVEPGEHEVAASIHATFALELS
jgi:uncharacterized protein YggE